MTVGDIVLRGTVLHPVALPNYLSAADAMAQAIGAYLAAARFRVYGGDDLEDRLFSLERVLYRWPTPETDLVYPCVSIIEIADTLQEAHSLTPTPLEDTWGTFDAMIGRSGGATVLWQEGTAVNDFQVDFWCDNDPDREAIDAQLSALFSPGEGRSGVLLEGPELYYSRNVRASLMATHKDDTGLSSIRRERRLRCVVSAECDIVSLRMATATTTANNDVRVADPNDPSEEVYQ